MMMDGDVDDDDVIVVVHMFRYPAEVLTLLEDR